MKSFLGARPAIECIGCHGSATEIGEVPFSYHFLENHFSTPLDTGNLYKCAACGLWFKHPYLPEQEVAAYYKSSSDELAWNANDFRPDFSLVKERLIETFPQGGSVLDVGCYRGEFLSLLPDSFVKHGIEPSLQASKAASSTGIQIIGGDLNNLRDMQFDAVTLFDVFEHLIDPVGTVDTLFSHLRPGGILCIVTGIADYPFFHRTGSKYNYVCLPEHSCFLTRKFAAFLSERYRSSYECVSLSRSDGHLRSFLRAAAIDLVNSPMLLLKNKKSIAKLYSSQRLKAISSKGFLPIGRAADHALLILRNETEKRSYS